MDGMILFLKPSVEQKAALDQLLLNLQDPPRHAATGESNPEQYADWFALVSRRRKRLRTGWNRGSSYRLDGRRRSAHHVQRNQRAQSRRFHANSAVSSVAQSLRQYAKSFHSPGARGLSRANKRSDAARRAVFLWGHNVREHATLAPGDAAIYDCSGMMRRDRSSSASLKYGIHREFVPSMESPTLATADRAQQTLARPPKSPPAVPVLTVERRRASTSYEDQRDERRQTLRR